MYHGGYDRERMMQEEFKHQVNSAREQLWWQWKMNGTWNKVRFRDYQGREIEVSPDGASIVDDRSSYMRQAMYAQRVYGDGVAMYSQVHPGVYHDEYEDRKSEDKKRKEEVRRREEARLEVIAKKKSNYRKVYWARYIQNAKKQNQSG